MLVYIEDYLAIEGDELNNDGSACVEVIHYIAYLVILHIMY